MMHASAACLDIATLDKLTAAITRASKPSRTFPGLRRLYDRFYTTERCTGVCMKRIVQIYGELHPHP